MPLSSTHVSTNALSESRTIMTPHCACFFFSSEKTKKKHKKHKASLVIFTSLSMQPPPADMWEGNNCVITFHKSSQKQERVRKHYVPARFCSSSTAKLKWFCLSGDEFLMLCNTAEPPSQSSKNNRGMPGF